MARGQKEGNVLSVRLSSKELATLRELVSREGGRVSDVIRDALDSYTATRRDSEVEWSVPENSRVFMYRGEPPRSQSLNPSTGSDQEIFKPSSSSPATTTKS